MPTKRQQLILPLIVLIFLALAVPSGHTVMPWSDEAWFSSPALNLITKGYFGTSILDESAAFRLNNLTGIHRHTYWIVPLYPLTQAGWYELTGFGVFSLRFLSTLWGLIALAACYCTMWKLSGDRRVAVLAVALLAVDFTVVWTASVGRMDMMCAALAQAGIAAYLLLREKHLLLAIFVSQACVVCSGLSHPMGLGGFAGVLFLTLYYDRKRIGLKHVAIASLPYLIGAGGWGLYIMQDPSDFYAQFHGNTADRFLSLTSPLESLRLQIVQRYLWMYGFAPDTKGLSHAKIIILLAYAAGVIGALMNRGIRRHPGYRVLLLLCGVMFLVMMVIDKEVHFFYLIHFVLLLAPILAVSLIWWWDHQTAPRWALAAGLMVVVAVQFSVIGRRVQQDMYQNIYLPTTTYLKRNAAKTDLIMGSSELAFQLGFDSPNLIDDFRLGFRSGKKPDFVVIDRNRYDEWIGLLQQQEPETWRYITDMMGREFHLVLDKNNYKIYARKAI